MKRIVYIGHLAVGGGQPIRVESMLKCPLNRRDECLKQLHSMADSGCELVRAAFPNVELKEDLSYIVSYSPIPLMADIHFDPLLAEAAISAGCPAIRINPGNMGDPKRLSHVVDLAKERKVVIRIGANSGSINENQLAAAGGDRGTALAYAVRTQAEMLLSLNFTNIIISAKSTNLNESLRANSLLYRDYGEFPFHIGITESGAGIDGIVKSSCGIGLLLSNGIGDTIRVSLSQSSLDEVSVAYSILRALNLRHKGGQLISCPTCGRKKLDVTSVIPKIQHLLKDLPDGFTLAVMGCEVNGPREAKHADLGIAGSPSGIVIFRHGEIVGRCPVEKTLETLKSFFP